MRKCTIWQKCSGTSHKSNKPSQFVLIKIMVYGDANTQIYRHRHTCRTIKANKKCVGIYFDIVGYQTQIQQSKWKNHETRKKLKTQILDIGKKHAFVNPAYSNSNSIRKWCFKRENNASDCRLLFMDHFCVLTIEEKTPGYKMIHTFFSKSTLRLLKTAHTEEN